MHLLEANQDKIDWNHLSANPSAIHLLEANPDKINWSELSCNKSAIHLLEQKYNEEIEERQKRTYWEKIKNFCYETPKKKTENTIDWQMLSINPAIFEEEELYIFK
jgi:hypothetical protein